MFVHYWLRCTSAAALHCILEFVEFGFWFGAISIYCGDEYSLRISCKMSLVYLSLRPQIPGSDSDTSWWMVHKVDPHYDTYRRQKLSIRSCIGHKYVYFYEVRCRIVALKSWYLYFLPHTLWTTFRNETLWNLLDVFTVHGPLWHGLGPVSISD